MNNTIKFILTIILGIFSGILSGCFGLGTTTLALPGFLILNIISNEKKAIGTTLVSSPLSWGAVLGYHKDGNTDILLGALYSVIFFIFSYFGALLNKMLNETTISISICVIYLLLAIYFLNRAFKFITY